LADALAQARDHVGELAVADHTKPLELAALAELTMQADVIRVGVSREDRSQVQARARDIVEHGPRLGAVDHRRFASAFANQDPREVVAPNTNLMKWGGAGDRCARSRGTSHEVRHRGRS